MKGRDGRAKRKRWDASCGAGRLVGGGEQWWQLEMEREKNLEMNGEKGRAKGRGGGGWVGGWGVLRGAGRMKVWQGVGHQLEMEKGGRAGDWEEGRGRERCRGAAWG